MVVAFMAVSSSLGYFLWLWALARTTPTNVTMFLALGPITATMLGALLLDEAITSLTVTGAMCVTVGLWLALRQAPDAPDRS